MWNLAYIIMCQVSVRYHVNFTLATKEVTTKALSFTAS